MPRPAHFLPLFHLLVLLPYLGTHLAAAGLDLHGPAVTADGGIRFSVSTHTNAYYRVFYSPDLRSMFQLGGRPRAIFAGPGEQSFTDPTPPDAPGFYRVQELLLQYPLDSDGDGIDDAWELEHPGTLDPLNPADAATDPDGNGQSLLREYQLSGHPLPSGVIASAPLLGKLSDVAVTGQVAVVAAGAAGVALFDVSDPLHPVRVGQLDTPGAALRVAAAGDLIAIAEDDGGLIIASVSDPAHPTVLHQLNLGSYYFSRTLAVAMAGDIVYASLNSLALVAVDAWTGRILYEDFYGQGAQDLFVAGTNLFQLNHDSLVLYNLANGIPNPAAFIPSPGSRATYSGGRRLFVGGGVAYVPHSDVGSFSGGYNTFSVTNSVFPSLIGHGDQGPSGWKQIVLNGSGLGLAVVGPAAIETDSDDVHLYDTSDPAVTDAWLKPFEVPGAARAVTLHQGLAYVASQDAGLQVLNYLPPDLGGQAPSIQLTTDLGPEPAPVAGNRLLAVTATTTDDVQVRNVDFYLDDTWVGSDGNFPFEFRFRTPAPLPGKTSFRLRAKAVDTGGNSTWSDELTLNLLADTTPPAVLDVTLDDALVGAGQMRTRLAVTFSEPMEAASLTPATLRLYSAGPDQTIDTPDDVQWMGGTASYVASPRMGWLVFDRPLSPDTYRVEVGAGVRDLAGNSPAGTIAWKIRVVDGDLTQGVTYPGSGSVNGSSKDEYRFTARAGQEVFVDLLSQWPPTAHWRLRDETGAELFHRWLNSRSPGRLLLSQGGRYTLTVNSNPDGAISGTYEFRILEVPPVQEFPLVIGGSVTNGVPGPGAGSIESPGARDTYTFEAAAGQSVFLKAYGPDQLLNELTWGLQDETGRVLARYNGLSGGAAGPVFLYLGGRYTLTIEGWPMSAVVGSYGFTLLNVPPPQQFAVAIGDTISNGVPRPGAGLIETPGAQDIYTFEASPGEEIYLRFSNFAEGLRTVQWMVRDEETRANVYFGNLSAPDSPRLQLTRGGRYTLTVNLGGGRAVTGPYTFWIQPIPKPEHFALTIGDSVTNGVPATGAGNIELAGTQDIYSFDAAAGERVYLQVDGFSQAGGELTWDLLGPGGMILFRRTLKQGNPGFWTLPEAGRYQLVVNADVELKRVGTYAFSLLPATRQEFTLALGGSVSNGIPRIGAGLIETPGAQDVYTFDASPGQVVSLDFTEVAPSTGYAEWELRDEIGVLQQGFLRPGRFWPVVLERGGRCTVTINSASQWISMGTYAFTLLAPRLPHEIPLTLGDVVTNGFPTPEAGVLATRGEQDVYTFDAPPGQVIFYETREVDESIRDVTWQLKDGVGRSFFSLPFRVPNSGRIVLETGGRYTLTVNSENLFNPPGSYSFRIIPLTPPKPFPIALGDSVTNGVPGPGAGVLEGLWDRDVYTFEAPAYQAVFLKFHDVALSAYSGLWDIRDETGAWVHSDFLPHNGPPRLLLERGGRYTLTINADDRVSLGVGAYAFTLLSVP